MDTVRYTLRDAVTVAILAVLAACSPPPGSSASPQRTAEGASAVPTRVVRPDSVPAARQEPPQRQVAAPPSLDVPQWPGHRFVLLRKNPLLEKFGYELFDSPRLGKETAAPRSRSFLKSHRLRSDLFAGRTVTATSVQAVSDSQFLVAFTIDSTDDTVWGLTRAGAIEGIAYAEDLAAARGAWTTVYSRRRLLDVYDSSTSRFSSITVSITEPIKVVDAVWGRTPLPPKPVWLIVERGNGVRGFIPLNMSWTNVPIFRRRTGMPWDDDVLDRDPKSLHRWDADIWETIDRHNVHPGMTREQARLSWGEPAASIDSTGPDGRRMQLWRYEAGTLVFPGDSLAAVLNQAP